MSWKTWNHYKFLTSTDIDHMYWYRLIGCMNVCTLNDYVIHYLPHKQAAILGDRRLLGAACWHLGDLGITAGERELYRGGHTYPPEKDGTQGGRLSWQSIYNRVSDGLLSVGYRYILLNTTITHLNVNTKHKFTDIYGYSTAGNFTSILKT